jgi:hypothetical protein
MANNKIDLVGKKYGMLTVVERIGKYYMDSLWKCICDCGKEYIGRGQRLKTGRIDNCGCQWRIKYTKHGMYGTKEYRAWIKMKERCLDPDDKGYANYGGRGISICSRWLGENGSTSFIKDMGLAPSKFHSLDRIRVNEMYEPTNCRWATAKEQSENKRNNVFYEYGNDKFTAIEWSRRLGLGRTFLVKRLKNNKTIEDIVREKGINYEYRPATSPVIRYAFGFIS